ncbi:MAG: hypothetical protein WD556_06615 [Actinomycetota bacterium]
MKLEERIKDSLERRARGAAPPTAKSLWEGSENRRRAIAGRSRLRAISLTMAVVIISLGGLGLLIALPDPSRDSALIGDRSVSLTDTALEGEFTTIVAGGGIAWISGQSSSGAHQLVSLDTRGGLGEPVGLSAPVELWATTPGEFWGIEVGPQNSQSLRRFDLDTGAASGSVDSIAAPVVPTTNAVLAVSTGENRVLTAVDASTLAAADQVPLPGPIWGGVVSEGFAWLVPMEGMELLRVDLDDSTLRIVPVGGAPNGTLGLPVVDDRGNLWIPVWSDHSRLLVVDGSSGDQLASRPLQGVSPIGSTGDRMWILGEEAVWAVDIDTFEYVHSIPLDSPPARTTTPPSAVVGSDGQIWVLSADGLVTRIDVS